MQWFYIRKQAQRATITWKICVDNMTNKVWQFAPTHDNTPWSTASAAWTQSLVTMHLENKVVFCGAERCIKTNHNSSNKHLKSNKQISITNTVHSFLVPFSDMILLLINWNKSLPFKIVTARQWFTPLIPVCHPRRSNTQCLLKQQQPLLLVFRPKQTRHWRNAKISNHIIVAIGPLLLRLLADACLFVRSGLYEHDSWRFPCLFDSCHDSALTTYS